MLKQLIRQPFFIILIPVFFVLHGCKENFGFIEFRDGLLLTISYLLAAIILFILFLFIFKNKIKAALLTSLLMSWYLFFGFIHDSLKTHIRFLSKYSFLISLLLISIVVSFVYLKRSRNKFTRLTLYLNLIFLIYIVVDGVSIGSKSLHPSVNKYSIIKFAGKKSYKRIEQVAKPDIYFLLFDEYASSLSLKEQYHFDNDLDSFLLTRGFSIQKKSFSNYNITPFSMASMLNMSYLSGISNNMKV